MAVNLRPTAILIAALLVASVVGCSNGGDRSDGGGVATQPASPIAAGGEVVATGGAHNESNTGAGPWSSQLKEAASNASSELERKILDDGTITAAEVAVAKQSFSSCLAAQGVTVSWEPDADAYSVGFPVAGTPSSDEMKKMEDQQRTCALASATNVISLYYQMRRNPQKQDEFTIIAACLVRKGVMPAGYSASDFARDRAMQPPPKPFESDAAGRCMTSPLEP